jgi:cobalt-zinc-cadmium efflux system outer membrane protein
MTAPRYLAAALALACGAAQVAAQGVAAADAPAFQAPQNPTDEPPEPVVEPAAPIALEDALALALLGNPELQGFSWEVRAEEARVLQAGLLPNPQLDLRYYELAQADGDEKSRTRVILSQDVELGGKRRKRVGLAEAERDVAGREYEARKAEVAATVGQRFVEVLGAQRRVEAHRGCVEDFLAMSRRVTGLVEAGVLGSLEIHRVARRVGMARIDLGGAESELAAARFALAATWGAGAPRFTEAAGELAAVEPLPDLESVIELARAGPEVALWDAEIERRRAALTLARSGRVPDMTYGVGTRNEEGLDDNDWLVDLEIGLPIFDRNQGGIREAEYELARAQAERKAAETTVGEETAALYYALQESASRGATLRDEILPAARATFEAFRHVFERNGSNLDDLLDARRDLARAESDLATALVDYHGNLAALESLAGRALAGS